MSLGNIKNAIKEFLQNDNPEVLCLRGKWGVGKTYLWKKCLDEAKETNETKLKYYSYVSLFGISSVQDLKLSIISQHEGFQGNKRFEAQTNSLKKMIGPVAPLLDGIWPDSQKALASFSFRILPPSIICFDDLERKAAALDMKEILGLVCYLRDEKKCKVVVLQNSDVLDDSNSKELSQYAEKVIDYDITLQPTAQNASQIALTGDDEVTAVISKNVLALGINNIRIIKKIQSHASRILSHLPSNKYRQETIKSALNTLCLYCMCYYDQASDKPDIEYVLKHGTYVESKNRDPRYAEWEALLHGYGYGGTDALDKQIFAFLKNGYIDTEEFVKAAQELDKQYQAGTAENEFREAWGLFHNSLEDNTTVLLDTIYAAFKRNVKNISPNNLNGTYNLFVDLGDQNRANEILEFYLKERSDAPDLFNPSKGELWIFEKPHADVEKAFENHFELHQKANPIPFDEAMLKVASNEGDREDEEALKIADIEQFYQFYKKLKGPKTRSCIKEILKYAGYSDDRTQIAEKAKKALEKLASESLVNQRRLKGWAGIKIDPVTD